MTSRTRRVSPLQNRLIVALACAAAPLLSACGARATATAPLLTTREWTYLLRPDGAALDWVFRPLERELLLIGTDPGGLAGTLTLLQPRTGREIFSAVYPLPYSAEAQAIGTDDTVIVATPAGVQAWLRRDGTSRWSADVELAPPFRLTASRDAAWVLDADSTLHRLDLVDGTHAIVVLPRAWHAVAASPAGATAWFAVSTTPPGSISGGRLAAIELRDDARESTWSTNVYYDVGSMSFDGPTLSFVGASFATARLDLRSGDLVASDADGSYATRFAVGPWQIAAESITGEFLAMVRLSASPIGDPDDVVWSRAYPARDLPLWARLDTASGAIVTCGTHTCAAVGSDGALLWTADQPTYEGDVSCETLFVFSSGVVSDCMAGSDRLLTGFVPNPR